MLNPSYKFFPSKLPISSLIDFPILLCHASMHSWKDSTGILRSSAVADLLMVSISGKGVFLITPPRAWGKKRKKNHMEPGRVSRKVATALWCSSRQESAGCTGCFMVKNPGVFLPQLSPLFAHRIFLWAYRLIVWSCGKNFMGKMPLTSKNTINIRLTILLSTPDSSTDSFGAWSPGRKWWFSLASLVRYQEARGCPGTSSYATLSGHHSVASVSSSRRWTSPCWCTIPTHPIRLRVFFSLFPQAQGGSRRINH